MASKSTKRPLFKGALKQPKYLSSGDSYTQMPALREEVSIVKGSKKDVVVAVEFSSRATPQPFLDPSIIERRIQAERQWQKEQGKKTGQDGELTALAS